MLMSFFVLTACNSDVIVKSDVGNITDEEFYDELKLNYGENLLQNMIVIKVLEDTYDVSDNEVDEKIEQLKNELGEQFQMWLLQEGFSSEESDLFRSRIHDLILQEKVQFEGIEVTDEEIEETYNDMLEDRQIEIKASHILFKLEEEDKENKEKVEEKKKLAQDVKKQLDEGADFAELAKEYSDDTSAENEGDIGYFRAGEMVPEFEETAYGLEVGEISEPIESQFGFHIITVTDIPTIEDKKEEIRYTILPTKVDQEEVQNKIDKLLKDANIDIKINDFEGLKEYFKFEDPELDEPSSEENSQNDELNTDETEDEEQNENTDEEDSNEEETE